MRIGELAQRVAGRRRARRGRPPGEGPKEIVPTDAEAARGAPVPSAAAPADPFDAARERLKARIPPPAEDD